jgi:hypothetical protein
MSEQRLPLPEWVQNLLHEWREKRQTGTLALHYCDGGVRNVDVQVKLHPPGVKRADGLRAA